MVIIKLDAIRFVLISDCNNSKLRDLNSFDHNVNSYELKQVFAYKAKNYVPSNGDKLYGTEDEMTYRTIVLDLYKENCRYILYRGNDSVGIRRKPINMAIGKPVVKYFDNVNDALLWGP